MTCGAVIVDNRATDIKHIISAHKKFLPKDWKVIHIKNAGIKSASDYNRLFCSAEFWDKIPFDKVLIFQHDSGLLKKGIEDFLHFDYIGASWSWNKEFPGNGGLSLRTVAVMKEICEKFSHNNMNEDHWFCKIMFENKIGRLATIEEADTFSIEQKYIFGSLGYHGIRNYFGEDQVQKILTQYDK